jgi:Cytochrome P460
MFGKLVYPAEEDMALPSSVMPSRFLNRLMVMLWDPKHKKASSDGWVYLRFINPDPRAPQDPASTGVWGVMSEKEVKACVECHARAADRGYVFSQPTFLFSDEADNRGVKAEKPTSIRFTDSMKEMAPKDIPRIAMNLIDSFPDWKQRKIMGYEGDFFSGALGEMGPVMAKMAQKDTGSIFLIYDRIDPNALQIVSSIKKKGHENCAGIVRLRGSGLNALKERFDKRMHELKENGDAAYPDVNLQNTTSGKNGVAVRDLSQEYKPTASLYIMCGADGINKQKLPLLYTKKDKDGLPSYYFAPAVLE